MNNSWSIDKQISLRAAQQSQTGCDNIVFWASFHTAKNLKCVTKLLIWIKSCHLIKQHWRANMHVVKTYIILNIAIMKYYAPNITYACELCTHSRKYMHI